METRKSHVQICPRRLVGGLLHKRGRKTRALAISALLATIMLASVGCYPLSRPQQQDGWAAPPAAFPITFAQSVSYAQALQGVTDLGLQPAVYCGYKADVAAGRVITGLRWQPAGQLNRFSQEHRLFVAATPLAAADWSSRVGVLPGVQRNEGAQPTYCPDAVASSSATTPSPNNPVVFTYTQLQHISYGRVEFASATDYSTALYEVSNLGLRLADPCYEKEQAQLQLQQKTPPWHPMGQEASFAASHVLVVAPAPLTAATTWAAQLRALPDSVNVETPYVPTC